MPAPALRFSSKMILLLVAIAAGPCAIGQEAETAPPKPAPLSIVTTELPHAVLHAAYYGEVRASGGTPPLKWTIARGTLPQGLELDDETGEITGQPAQVGDFAFTVEVSD